MRSHETAICRIAFDLRRPDARRRAEAALARAVRDGQVEAAGELTELLSRHRHRRLREGDDGPLPETVAKRRPDPISRLVWTGCLTVEHEAKADEIARVFEAITVRCGARGMRLEQGRVPGSWDQWMRMSDRLARTYRRFYVPWCNWMTHASSVFRACADCLRLLRPGERCCRNMDVIDQPRLSLALSLCVFRESLEQTAAAHSIGRRRAGRLLRWSLDRYRQ